VIRTGAKSHRSSWTAVVPATHDSRSSFGSRARRAPVVRRGRTVTVPAGTFANTITVRDFNPLDGSKGTKVYAPGVGLIVDGPLELIDF
jgi:hypothetical protein